MAAYKYLLMCLLSFLMPLALLAQDLAELINKLPTTEGTAKVLLLKQIAGYYQKQQAFNKAVDYFKQALEIQQQLQIDATTLQITRQSLAYCYKQQNDYPKAIAEYEQILAQQTDKNAQLNTLNELAYLHKLNLNYPQALLYTQKTLDIYLADGDTQGVMSAYNNLGYLHNETGNSLQSLDHYQKALNYSRQQQLSKLPSQKAVLYTNTGVTYTYLRDFKTANQYFLDALNIYEKQGDLSRQAQSNNYLAANYYISGKNEIAIDYALKAKDIAQSIGDEPTLLVSYQILEQAYQQEGDFKESRKYLLLQQELKEKISEKERLKRQKLLEEEINIEKKENEIKQIVAERDRKEMDLQRSESERQRQIAELKNKENELALLKSKQEAQNVALRNQQLEKDRVQQLLEITRQKSIADKERLLAEQQKGEAARLKLTAEKNRIEKEKEQKAREASEQKSLVQQKQLESEKSLRNYSYAIIALIALVLVLAIVGLVKSRRDARKLRDQNRQIQEQNNEIEAQNEELHQNQEEILAQRDFIEQKNKELEDYNRQVKSSINAAVTIQQAILPYKAKLDKILGDYFVIFQPKDVVSGDFFWLNETEGKKTLVSADCTGHGVPGAFMTLIGNTLLDKIIRVWKITQPADILSKLHEEIKVVLRQEETGNNNGMDANVLVWQDIDQDTVRLEWSGAKHNLFFLPHAHKEMQTLKGVRRALGGEQNEKIAFITEELTLPKGSLVFMGSDGLTDQNDKQRKRFGEQRLVELLQENSQIPLQEQKQKIEAELQAFMHDTAQRDDILWIGFKL